MASISALIVEDNSFFAEVLSDLLQQNHPNIELMGVAQNGTEGIQKIKSLNPDIVFLDIEMPDMSGFEMLNQLDQINFQTIFTTAHSQYAIIAFRFNALDYLLKPIHPKELKEAIQKFIRQKDSFGNQERVLHALQNFKEEVPQDQKLVLPTQKGTLRIALKKIIKIEGERNYSYIYFSNGTKELSSKTLGHFESVLADKGFKRCHRSFLVNHLHIQDLKGSSLYLKDQSQVPISRRKLSEVKDWYLNYGR